LTYPGRADTFAIVRTAFAVTGYSLLAGLVFGSLARLVMRGITVVEGDEPEFSGGATAGIVSFFMIAALGGGWGGSARQHPRAGLGLALIATLPVTLLGIGIGGGDLIQSTGDQPPGRVALTLLGTLVIAACVAAAPTVSWRRARAG
jgi:hypothetical protein